MKFKRIKYIVIFTLIILFIPCFIHTKQDISTNNKLNNKTQKETEKSEVDKNEMAVFFLILVLKNLLYK